MCLGFIPFRRLVTSDQYLRDKGTMNTCNGHRTSIINLFSGNFDPMNARFGWRGACSPSRVKDFSSSARARWCTSAPLSQLLLVNNIRDQPTLSINIWAPLHMRDARRSFYCLHFPPLIAALTLWLALASTTTDQRNIGTNGRASRCVVPPVPEGTRNKNRWSWNSTDGHA